MWYLLLLSFVLYARADYEGNILTVNIEPNTTDTNLLACYTAPRKLMEDQEAFINFYINDTDYLENLETCIAVKGDQELKLKLVDKNNNWKRFKIDDIEPWMNQKWKCDLIKDGTCIIDIHVSSKDIPKMQINSKIVEMDRTHSSIVYDALGTYYLSENQIVGIKCKRKGDGPIKFDLQGEAVLTGFIDRDNITMWMKMSNENDNKYIDCTQNKTGMLSTIRTVLKLKPVGEKNDPWRLEINNQVVDTDGVKPPLYINYYYIKGETLNISCQNANEDWSTAGQGFINYTRDTNLRNDNDMIYCPNKTNDFTDLYAKIKLTEIDTRGLRGLLSQNIKFMYVNNTDDPVIHYEYAVKDNLTLIWMVEKTNDATMEYRIQKNDELIYSQKYKDKGEFKIYIPTITLGHQDHHSIIQFRCKESKWNSTYYEKIRIILYRKTIDEKPGKKPLKLGILFGVGVGVFSVLLITILIATCFIIKRSNARKCASSSHTYDNLLGDESPTSSFPPQWDRIAAQALNDPNYAQVRDSYAVPVPRRLRDDNRSGRRDEFYGATVTRENSLYDKQPDNVYTYVENNREENLYCEINN